MKNTFRFALSGIAIIGVAACSPHQDKHMHQNTMTHNYFNMVDSNNNGVITRGEARIYADSEFSQADTNRDGLVTLEELSAMKRLNRNAYGVSNADYSQSYDDPRHMRADTYHSNDPRKGNSVRSGYDYNNNDDNYYYDRNSKRWERR